MAKTVTFLELRTRVRFLGDFEDSIPIDDTRLGEVVNSSIGKVWNLLLRYRGDAYEKEQTPAPATAIGIDYITLAADFYRLVQVEVLDGSNYVRLDAHKTLDRGALSQNAVSPRDLRYRFSATVNPVAASPVVRLVPTPTAVWPLRITYLPSFADLVVDADTFDGVNGFEDLVIAQAVKLLKMRESMPMGEWEGEVQKLEREITGEAGDLDSGTPFTLGSSPRYMVDEDDRWW